MTEYDNTNRGVLFKNDRKTEDWHADYKGNLNVNGVEMWLDATIREGKSGQKFMSVKVRPKEQQSNPSQAKPAPDMSAPIADDDVPF